LSGSEISANRLPKNVFLKTNCLSKVFSSTAFATSFHYKKWDECYDVVHCPTVLAPLPLLFNRRIRKVMTVHDLVPVIFPEFSNFKKYLYYRYILRLLFYHIDHFIVPSIAVRNNLIEQYMIRPERVSVVYEGVAANFRQSRKQKQDYILAVSTIEPRKNFKRIIEAYIHLKKKHHITAKLVIVGKYGWSCKSVYRIPDKYMKCIIFKGYVPEVELIKLYQHAKLFIYPSLYEGFGLPVIEAMACGCPVITSNLSSLPEIAGKAAILVNPYKKDEIASAIVEVLGNEELAKSLEKKGIEQASKFSWTQCAQNTIKVYEAVLKQ
jgi:glycosyltransferase involved in cell wall biosynthesis